MLERPKNGVDLRTHIGLPLVEDFNQFKSDVIDHYGSRFSDNAHANRDLLAVSSSLQDERHGESAVYFMTMNGNISTKHVERFRPLFELYGAHHEEAEHLALEATKVAREKQRAGAAGALYVIAIPRYLVDENFDKRFIYLCHPFGLVKEASKSQLLHNLEMHTQEQYRLIIEPMMRHPKVKAMQITALPKEAVKQYKKQAKEIASAVMACALGNAA